MVNENIYEVERNYYKSFVNELKDEFKEIKNKNNDKYEIIEIYSKKTGKRLCSRKTDTEGQEPEKYYIYEMPDDDERKPAKPVYQLKLETKEEVQAFLNALSELNKKNG